MTQIGDPRPQPRGRQTSGNHVVTDGAGEPGGRTVILCVAASDAHVVANRLLAYFLTHCGFSVINLGACTPLHEVAEALQEHPDAEAVIIGSLNGHAYQDLSPLPTMRASGWITCPVVLGGNLSVGASKQNRAVERLRALGINCILNDFAELPAALDHLRDQHVAVRVPEETDDSR